MNSYPHEFLAHPQPLMFVAGLTESGSSSTRARSASVVSNSSASGTLPAGRSRGLSISQSLDKSAQGGITLTSPLSPRLDKATDLPSSPTPDDKVERLGDQLDVPQELSPRDQEFQVLVDNLRGALSGSSPTGKVSLPERERNAFKIMLVDKAVRLPLRKIAPPAGSTEHTPHSPLSPLTSSSPLYPDGIMSPIWVRKHAELVPSVFVLFLRLWEPEAAPEGESAEQREERDKADREKEREMDDALVKEIGDRRRRMGERGIKLTVVLMASAATLDSPTLDPRLSYLRRASALSAKASLFVLSPIPAEELPDFVQSLQEALYESALEYYGAHAKRVRRKRARLPAFSGPFAASTPALTESGRALGPQGWGVRYDWKAGWFAEVRGEYEIARRHYEDCWNELARMFSSTQILPPRTKRWAEAKVLADCVAMRICRLLLYEGAAGRITGPFLVHLKRFGDLSRGWGIGEETFEFWSWIARQYRVFAELLELGIASGLRLPPSPLPVFPTQGPPAGLPSLEYWTTPTSSINPTQALQQPAYYYYAAAMCSVQRQLRFQEALEAENEAAGTEAGGYLSSAPGFASEKKVDHAALVVELLTKAYSLLQDHDEARNHAALYVAYRIAETHAKAGQHELAMKFFDRISPSFKKTNWTPIVAEIRQLWYECAQATGNVEIAARLLLEMMSPASRVEFEDREALQEDLLSLLKTTAPSSTDPIAVHMDTGHPLLNVRAGFWQSISTIPANATFQLVLESPHGVDISNISFDSLQISFSDRQDVVTVKADGESLSASKVVDLGVVGSSDVLAPLKWGVGGLLVLNGQLPGEKGEATILSVKLNLKQGSWDVQLLFSPGPLAGWSTPRGVINPVHQLSSTVSFTSPPHGLKFEVDRPAFGYTGEPLPISLKITSEDERDFDLKISVFLQPSDEDDGATIAIDGKQSPSFLDAISLGTLSPNGTVDKIILLDAPRQGTRIVDLSLQSTSPDGSVEEKVQTVQIPVVPPFEVGFGVSYNSTGVGEADASIEAVLSSRNGAQRPLIVDGLTLEPSEDDSGSELVSSSLEGGTVPTAWNGHARFAVWSQFKIHSSRRPSLSAVPPAPGHLFISWKTGEASTPTRTAIQLPPLILPINESFISAALSAPATATLHQLFPVTLELTNSHPTHDAMVIVELGTAEAFVWRGNRVSQVLIPAGKVERVKLEMAAVGVTGKIDVPRVSVFEERKPGQMEGTEIKVVGKEGTKVLIRP